jgi:putative PIN family toxin of toxin-antitoxin system
MRRIVLDTNILAAGLRSQRGASFAILALVAKRQLQPMASVALFLEYESVLKRPEQMQGHGMSLLEIDQLLKEFAALLVPVDIHFQWRPQLADPGDELVLEAAVNGRADFLVTHNTRDFAAAERFGLSVLRPADFLKGLRR